jgi:competence protein ComEC
VVNEKKIHILAIDLYMLSLTRLPALRLLIPFVGGSLWTIHTGRQHTALTILLVAGLLVFAYLFFSAKSGKRFRAITVQGVLVYVVLFLFGHLYTFFMTPSNRPNHYSHFTELADSVRVVVAEHPRRSGRRVQYEARLTHLYTSEGATKVSGKVLVVTDGNAPVPSKGGELVLPAVFSEPSEARNPGGFDYRAYLASRHIHHIIRADSAEIHQFKAAENPFDIILNKYYSGLQGAIEEYIPGHSAAGIARALLLGDKSGLETDTRDVFSNTGTMHILAVSGLHVGIIYLIAGWVLGIIPVLKSRVFLRTFLLLGVIWAYAVLTGLSPSIFRAAVMFTFLSLGRPAGRLINTYNILAAAAWVLLLIDPWNIMQVGFQLSFLAVWGIVTLQPPIERLWYLPYKPLRYLWSLAAVSIAAQVATAPLSIYVFDQFPLLFIPANLFAVPLAFVVMLTGVLFMALFSVPGIGSFIAVLLNAELELLGRGLELIGNIPHSVSDGFQMDLIAVLLLYLCLFLIWKWLDSSERTFPFAAAWTLLLAMVWQTAVKRNDLQNDMLVFHATKGSVMSYLHGKQVHLFTDVPVDSLSGYGYDIEPLLKERGVNDSQVKQHTVSAGTCLDIGHIHIVVPNPSTDHYPDCQPDFVWLKPGYIDWEQVLPKYSNAIWILDNSLSWKQHNYLKKELAYRNVNYHSLREQYAFIYPVTEAP